MKRYYKIAGLTVEMDTFGRIVTQSEPYTIDPIDDPQIIVKSNFEKARREFPKLSDSDCEYLATGANFYKQILHRYNGFMLHSSAIVVDGKAYIFTANSGVGKSTHTQLWLELFKDRAYILNDDKPALRLEQGKWYAYGTPWSGKHDLSRNERIPIGGIAVLARGEEDSIERFSGIQAITEVMRQVNKPNDSTMRENLMELLDNLMCNVPIWKLHCTKNISSAILAYEKMSGERLDKE